MAYYAASIDDNDPAFIYSDGWVLVTQDGSWTGTMHSTSVPGSVARVRFTGSRAAAVFTIPTGPGTGVSSRATFSIDNGPAVAESHITTPPVQWNTVLWDSGPLPMGNHLLIITNTGNEAYLRLDRLDYDPTDSNAPSSVVAAPAASSTTPASTSPTTVTAISKAASSSPILPSSTSKLSGTLSGSSLYPSSVSTEGIPAPSSSSLSSSISGGATSAGDATSVAGISSATESMSAKSTGPSVAMIGGVLGGLSLVLLIGLAVGGICMMRRRRQRHYSDPVMAQAFPRSQVVTGIPTPYDLNASERSSNVLLASRVGAYSTAGSEYMSVGSYMPNQSSGSDIHSAFHSSQEILLSAHQRPTYGIDSQIDSTLSAKQAEHLQTRLQQRATVNGACIQGESGRCESQTRIDYLFGDGLPPPAYHS